MIETIIDAKGVWKRYDAGRHKIDALKGVDRSAPWSSTFRWSRSP
jgi:hypothetical protein